MLAVTRPAKPDKESIDEAHLRIGAKMAAHFQLEELRAAKAGDVGAAAAATAKTSNARHAATAKTSNARHAAYVRADGVAKAALRKLKYIAAGVVGDAADAAEFSCAANVGAAAAVKHAHKAAALAGAAAAAKAAAQSAAAAESASAAAHTAAEIVNNFAEAAERVNAANTLMDQALVALESVVSTERRAAGAFTTSCAEVAERVSRANAVLDRRLDAMDDAICKGRWQLPYARYYPAGPRYYPLKDVPAGEIKAGYDWIAANMADAGTLEPLIKSYSSSIAWVYKGLVRFEKDNELRNFLVAPVTPVPRPCPYMRMIDTRTHMSVHDTIQMLKIVLSRRHGNA